MVTQYQPPKIDYTSVVANATTEAVPSYLQNYNLPALDKLNYDAGIPQLYKSKTYTPAKNVFTDYNSQFDVNSLADLFFGTLTSPNKWDYFKSGSSELVHALVIDPIKEGDLKALAINNLMNMVETLDAPLANPIKALAQGYGWEGVKESYSIGTAGRVNHDMNTGNVIADVMLEIVLDPLNYASLGTAGAAKQIAKSGVKRLSKDLVKESLTAAETKNLARAQKTVAKSLFKTVLDNDYETFLKKVDKHKSILEHMGLISVDMFKSEADYIKYWANLKSLRNSAQTAIDLTVLEGLAKTTKAINKAESNLVKLSLTSLYPAGWVIAKGGSRTSKYFEHQLQKKWKANLRPDGTLSPLDFDVNKALETNWRKEFAVADTTSSKKESDLPEQLVLYKTIQGAQTDYENIVKIYDLLSGEKTTKEIYIAINELLTARSSVGSNGLAVNRQVTLEQYISALEKLSAGNKNAFDPVLNSFKHLQEVLKDHLTYTAQKEVLANAEAELKQLEQLEAFVKRYEFSVNNIGSLNEKGKIVEEGLLTNLLDNETIIEGFENINVQRIIADLSAEGIPAEELYTRVKQILLNKLFENVLGSNWSQVQELYLPNIKLIAYTYMRRIIEGITDLDNKYAKMSADYGRAIDINNVHTYLTRLLRHTLNNMPADLVKTIKYLINHKYKDGVIVYLDFVNVPVSTINSFTRKEIIKEQILTELNLNDVPNTLKEMFDPVLDSFVNRLPSDAVKIKVPDHVLKGLEFKYQELLRHNRANVLNLRDTLKAPNTDLIKVIDSGKISEDKNKTILSSLVKAQDQYPAPYKSSVAKRSDKDQEIVNIVDNPVADETLRTPDEAMMYMDQNVYPILQGVYFKLDALFNDKLNIDHRMKDTGIFKHVMNIRNMFDNAFKQTRVIKNNVEKTVNVFNFDIDSVFKTMDTMAKDFLKTNVYSEIQEVYAPIVYGLIEQAKKEIYDTIIKEPDVARLVFKNKIQDMDVSYSSVPIELSEQDVLVSMRTNKVTEHSINNTAGELGTLAKTLLNTTQGFGKQLLDLRDALAMRNDPSAQHIVMFINELVDSAREVEAYRNFMIRIANSSIKDEVRSAAMDVIHSLDHTSLEDVLADIDDIIRKIDSIVYVNHGFVKLNMDTFLEGIDNWGPNKELNERFKEKGLHEAYADVKFLEYVIDAHLPDLFKNYPGSKRHLIADIETNGTDASAAEVLQIAMVDHLTGKAVFTGNVRILPQDLEFYLPNETVLLKVYGKTYDEAYANFVKKHVITDPKKEKPFYPKQLLEKFNELFTEGDVLAAHNGSGFDVPFLNKQFNKYKINSKGKFESTPKIDTLSELQRKYCKEMPDANEKERLYYLITTYAYEMIEKQFNRLIPNFYSRVKDLLQNMELATETKAKADPIFSSFASVTDELRAVILDAQQTKEAWSTLSNNMQLNPAKIKDPELRRKYLEEFAASFNTTVDDLISKTITKTEEGLMTPYTGFLYRTYGGNEFLYRNVIDAEQVLKYADLNDVLLDTTTDAATKRYKLPMKDWGTLSKLAKNYEKHISYIHDMRVIKAEAEQLAGYVRRLLDEYLPVGDVRKRLKVSVENPEICFAILSQLYSSKSFVFTAEMLDAMPPGVRYLMDTPKEVYSRKYLYERRADQEKSYFKNSISVEDKEFNAYTAAEDYEKMVNTLDNLENVSIALSEKNANAAYYASMNMLRTLSSPIKKILNWIKNGIEGKNPELFMIKYSKFQNDYLNMRGAEQIYNFVDQTAEELEKDLVSRNNLVCFTIDDTGRYRGFTQEAYNKLKVMEPELNERGIKIITVPTLKGGTKVYVVKSVLRQASFYKDKIIIDGKRYDLFKNAPLKNQIPPDTYPLEGLEGFIKDIDEVERGLLELSDGDYAGSFGETLTEHKLREYWEQLPFEVRKEFGDDVNKFIIKDYYKALRYDKTNIGLVRSRVNFFDFNPIKNTYPPSTKLHVLLSNAVKHVAQSGQAKLLYADMLYTPMSGINSGAFSTEGLSAEEALKIDQSILDSLRRNEEFVLSAYIVDGKGKPRVVQITADSIADIQAARKLNAAILPYQVYSRAFEVLNDKYFDNKFLNLWQKIIYTYKIGYLLDPGVFMRNFIDGVMKNMASTDTGVIEYSKAAATAAKLLHDYNVVAKDIIKCSKDGNTYDWFAKRTYFGVYKDKSLLSEGMYDFMHGYILDGPSAGRASVWNEFYGLKKLKQVPEGYKQGLFTRFAHTANSLMKPNQAIEQINRLAQYIILEQHGVTKTQIFKEIAKTHFDYSVKTLTDRYAELIIPFYTFTVRNLEYFIRTIEEHPQMYSWFKSTMMPVFNFDEYTPADIKYNASLQYQILSGNMQLDTSGLTLKLNPSALDAFNLITQAPSNLLSKTAEPIQGAANVLLQQQGEYVRELFEVFSNTAADDNKILKLMDSMPVVGSAKQRYWDMPQKYHERTGKIAPHLPGLTGIFGATKQNNYTPKQYKYKAYVPYGTWGGSGTWDKDYYNRPSNSYYPNTYPQGYYPSNNYTPKGGPRPITIYPRRYYPTNLYNSLYTKASGTSRLRMNTYPVTSETLKYRIQNIQYNFSKII